MPVRTALLLSYSFEESLTALDLFEEDEEIFHRFWFASSMSICSCLHSWLQNGVSPLKKIPKLKQISFNLKYKTKRDPISNYQKTEAQNKNWKKFQLTCTYRCHCCGRVIYGKENTNRENEGCGGPEIHLQRNKKLLASYFFPDLDGGSAAVVVVVDAESWLREEKAWGGLWFYIGERVSNGLILSGGGTTRTNECS